MYLIYIFLVKIKELTTLLNMTKNEINVESLLYNPFEKNPLNKLRHYDEFANIKDDKILAYIILAYDLKSDIRKEYPSRNQQKVEAAKLAGFKFTLNQFDKSVEEILIGDHYDVDKAIVKYLSFFGKPELMALEFLYNKMNDLLYQQRKGDDEKDSHKTIIFLKDNINELTEIIFGGVETITARSALYEFIQKNSTISVRPENIGEKLADGEVPLDGYNPYGDEYEIPKMKYLGSK